MPLPRLSLEDCLKDGPPFQALVYENEHYIHVAEGLLKGLSKSSRTALECDETVAKANLAVAEALEAVGRFELNYGDDAEGILGRRRMLKRRSIDSE